MEDTIQTAIIVQALRLWWYDRYGYGSEWWKDAYHKLGKAVEAFTDRYPTLATELRENSNDFTPEDA